MVLAIVLGSTLLGFAQEYIAGNATEKLRSKVNLHSTVLRDGQPQILPSSRVVPGDLVLLSAGSLIPADGVVLEAKDFFINQAVLTGETFPVEKKPGVVADKAALAERGNCVYMGTSVSSGSARVVIVQTGKASVFGQIAGKLALRPPMTEFERGLQRFGFLLTPLLVMVVAVLAINIFVAKPPIDSLLFALALAVGLTPEMLPAIVSITLSRGARRMARLGVIVRRLNAIENLGSMDVLCTDKTGTLTAGVVESTRGRCGGSPCGGDAAGRHQRTVPVRLCQPARRGGDRRDEEGWHRSRRGAEGRRDFRRGCDGLACCLPVSALASTKNFAPRCSSSAGLKAATWRSWVHPRPSPAPWPMRWPGCVCRESS